MASSIKCNITNVNNTNIIKFYNYNWEFVWFDVKTESVMKLYHAALSNNDVIIDYINDGNGFSLCTSKGSIYITTQYMNSHGVHKQTTRIPINLISGIIKYLKKLE